MFATRTCCVAGRYQAASSLREDLNDLALDDAYRESLSILADILTLGCPACIQLAVRTLHERLGWPENREAQLAILLGAH